LKIFVRACSTSTNYWPASKIWRILSELVLLLIYTDHFQQFGDFCQSLFFYQILTAFKTSSDKNLQIVESCQYLVEVEQALTISSNCWKLSVFGRRTSSAFNNLKIFVRACSTSTKYWSLSTIWRFLSEFVLLLPNTDSFHQFGDFCQRSSEKNLQIVEGGQYLGEVEQALT
jgi:hypothetical protein